MNVIDTVWQKSINYNNVDNIYSIDKIKDYSNYIPNNTFEFKGEEEN